MCVFLSDEQKQRHEQSLSEEVEALKLRSKLEADQLMAETRETFQREKRFVRTCRFTNCVHRMYIYQCDCTMRCNVYH